ncbi:uncharacterized protein B0H18DRAFT_1191122 [Fomitopsis serialis]|uniref:uncharacterized protein n=1 Tax=Fomitopsis serialis TaxID=139415 RepID=UPI002007A954|nr:uncharacterized protein B0H18DRAFT_1191122 [Neoantrodia serialis]KAH9907685.1 hypothetical protein B0H18DRAFT_1191122 [Neoantrodia serialis]
MLPTATPANDWLLNILGQNMDWFVEDVWSNSRECPLYTDLNHVLVISMEKDHFGKIYDYYMLYNSNTCAMELSSKQASDDARATALEQALELNPPAKFGGFLLMAALDDLYGECVARPLISQFTGSLGSEGRLVLVEAVVYIDDRFPAMSIPLIGVLDWTQGNSVIPGPFEQPVLSQVFPYFNRYKVPSDPDTWTMFDIYSPELQLFVPARIGNTFPIKFNLHWLAAPPILKVSGVEVTKDVVDLTNGKLRRDPMCSMKHTFIEMRWVWPVCLQKPRKVMDANGALIGWWTGRPCFCGYPSRRSPGLAMSGSTFINLTLTPRFALLPQVFTPAVLLIFPG